MENNMFILGQKITGLERKAIAGRIAEVVGGEAKYQGLPSYAFKVGEWAVDRAGVVHSPETDFASAANLKTVFDSLNAAGMKPEGDIIVTLSAEGHTGITLRNLANIVSSKERLLQCALNRQNGIIPQGLVAALNSERIDTVEDFMQVYQTGIEEGRYPNDSDMCFSGLPEKVSFSFFNATFNIDEITAYVALSIRLNEQAKAQKHTTAKQKDVENEKYAFRCFLLRLGFIGDEYKTARKVLLSRVEGDGSRK